MGIQARLQVSQDQILKKLNRYKANKVLNDRFYLNNNQCFEKYGILSSDFERLFKGKEIFIQKKETKPDHKKKPQTKRINPLVFSSDDEDN